MKPCLALSLAGLLLCGCTIRQTERRQVNWETIRPSEVIRQGVLVDYDAPEPALVRSLKKWADDVFSVTLTALDAARPAGTLLPQATTLSWAEAGQLAQPGDISFPAGKTVVLTLACPGGCEMQSRVTWTPDGWFSSPNTLASFGGELRADQVAQLRFQTPPERAAHLSLQLSACGALNGKCAYAASAITEP